MGPGQRASQILDIDDTCQAICLCLSMPRDLVNDTFNVGARPFATIRETLQAVLDRAGHGKRVIRIPTALVTGMVSLLERLPGSSRYSWVRETAGQDSYLSVRHIGVKLDFSRVIPVPPRWRATMRDTRACGAGRAVSVKRRVIQSRSSGCRARALRESRCYEVRIAALAGRGRKPCTAASSCVELIGLHNQRT